MKSQMYNELALCRAVMRLYSFCDIEYQTHKLTYSEARDVLTEYFQIEPSLKAAFHQAGIHMYPTRVNSCFGNTIKTVPEVFFIYERNYYTIPVKIITCLQEFLSLNGRNNSPSINQQLFWAYSGRYYDKKSGARYITDGLQGADQISIDFLTYSVATHDCLHHRLVHELLHVLGVEEEDMSRLILPACKISYELSKDFVDSLLDQISVIKNEFITAVLRVSESKQDLTSRILLLADILCQYGFPTQMETPLYTTTYMPSTLLPDVLVDGYEVLFM